MFWGAACSLLRAEGFFYNLDVLYGGLGIGKLQLFNCNFLKIFGYQNPGFGSVFILNAGSGSGSVIKWIRIWNTNFYVTLDSYRLIFYLLCCGSRSGRLRNFSASRIQTRAFWHKFFYIFVNIYWIFILLHTFFLNITSGSRSGMT